MSRRTLSRRLPSKPDIHLLVLNNLIFCFVVQVDKLNVSNISNLITSILSSTVPRFSLLDFAIIHHNSIRVDA